MKIEERVWEAARTPKKRRHCGTADSPMGRFPFYLISLSLGVYPTTWSVGGNILAGKNSIIVVYGILSISVKYHKRYNVSACLELKRV